MRVASTNVQSEGRPLDARLDTTNAPMKQYPDLAAGLETLMQDMLQASRNGNSAALTAYFNSLELPDPETWFDAHFGRTNCGDQQLTANDCLGPRLALTYSATSRSLAVAVAKTLLNLLDEKLTTFEAVNYAEPCAYNLRIVPAQNLISQLSTTPIITSSQFVSGQGADPTYMLWAYNETEETMIGYFVYSKAAFRYIGNPHPASLEEFASGTAPHERRESDDLTFEIVSPPQVLIDFAASQHTVILHALINADGRLQKAAYIRGPIALRDDAIEAARQHHFSQPFTLGGQKFATDGCLSVVLSESPPRIESFSSQVRLSSAEQ